MGALADGEFLKGKPVLIQIAAPSEAILAVDATNIVALINSFLENKRQTITEKSYSNYVIDLAPFLAWWETQEDPVLNRQRLNTFVDWLRNEWRNLYGKPATAPVAGRVCQRLRQVLEWGHANGFIPVRLAHMVPTIPEFETLKYFPTPDEIYGIIMATTGDTRLRDASIIAMLAATGARRFELAAVEIEDLEFFGAFTDLAVDGEHSGYVRLRKTKGDREGQGVGRISLFDGRAGLLLKAYLRASGRTSGNLYDMTDANIRKIVQQCGERAGLPQIHPHAFRSAFVDHWSDVNALSGEMAMIALRLQIGHSLSNDVTNRYRDLKNHAKNIRRIRQFYVSPLQVAQWGWDNWPVHIPQQENNGSNGIEK